ncbi:hypothetical protein L8V85_02595 [Campylobacter sp. IFREMER_LSEM_CL2090]|uniref:coiled-coil domain-containing protein n=1 Tax=Campylobacter sp. IFREMER_LSEM_CL2090 TaxID=2911617 RepID=UPI0021E950F9|nr:hypothetical protein [Campylobacter sp. IFREMER_LSEM_CL2090]MCV3402845.1 hypothetical protein [Campylobacter sp. IFREMER_LSEM_CL2090]
MSEFNTYSISIKDKNGMGFEGELINKKEVDHALQNLNKELEKTSNDLKKAQEELKDSKDKLLQSQMNLDTTSETLKKTQNELDSEKEKHTACEVRLKDKTNELEKTQSALEKTQNELKDEKDKANNFKDKLSSALNALEKTQNELKSKEEKLNECETGLKDKTNELEKTQNELDNIKENTHFSLYEYYQANKENLREFNSNGFKDQCEFLVKALNLDSLKNLHFIIKTKTLRESNDLQYYVDFFEKLYKALEKYHDNLERFETKEGEKFDFNKHDKIRGNSQGKIKKIFFIGFRISHHIYNSLVEVE